MTAGSKLGSYEILSPLGAGAMGEVYRARDRRLGRQVAVKILPASVANDPERLSRFEREARAASALNHPNIVTVYEVGRDADISWIAMELVDGTSLADLVSSGPLSIQRLLAVAPQIAEGLAKAHAAGIVHRDMKPANVMVSSDGFVKIVDFGVAKLSPIGPQVSLAPTDAGPETLTGSLLGTIAYMSPEQASGRTVDYRSDQFSFGSILYEMATGRRPFERDSAVDTLSAILHDNPEPIDSSAGIPAALRWAIERCLCKDPGERYESTKDLARDLIGMRERALPPAPTVPLQERTIRRRPAGRAAFWIAAGTVAIGLIAGGLTILGRHPERPVRAIRATLDIPTSEFGAIALSPDGSRLAYVASSPGEGRVLWIRPLGSTDSTPVRGTRGARMPFWSPDGKSVGFFAAGKLKRVDIEGGVARVLCAAQTPFGGAWSQGGWIFFASNYRGGLSRVRAEGGGAPEQATTLDPRRHDSSHRWPKFLPDGRHFLAVMITETPSGQRSALFVGTMDSLVIRPLLSDVSNALYAPPGFLVYARDGNLLAQPFDLRTLRASGEPKRISQQSIAYQKRSAFAEFTGSEDGVLVYKPSIYLRTEMLWTDKTGRVTGRLGENGYSKVRISPGGQRIAVVEADPETTDGDIWVVETARGNSTRLTFHPAYYGNLAWTPDEKTVLFESDRGGTRDIYRKRTNGAGEEEVLLHSSLWKALGDVSPDGRFLLFNPRSLETDVDLWAMSLDGDRKTFPLLVTRFDEHAGRFSPDGRWIAYVSGETGEPEVYVRGFPGPGEKVEVSNGPGTEPRWSRDGKELYFEAPGGKVMAVQVRTGTRFEASGLKLLFEAPGLVDLDCCSEDGQNFLLVRGIESQKSSGVILLTGWFPPGSN